MNDASPAMSLLEVRDLHRNFKMGGRRLDVLRGVDLSVAEGEFVAIQGSSGGGKSTLLHLVGLLDRPDAGRILYDGREVGTASEAARTRIRATETAFVFQLYYLLPEFSALENVLMAARIAGGRSRAADDAQGAKERARGLLERVGLKDRMNHRPQKLSGGERQRVAIARALVHRPRLVLCDEPTGNLDSRTAAGIHELLIELNRDLGQTFLVVTHEADMARIAARRLHMRDGIVTPAGEGDEEATA